MENSTELEEQIKKTRLDKEKVRFLLWDLSHSKNIVNEQEHMRKIHELSKKQTVLIEKLIELETEL